MEVEDLTEEGFDYRDALYLCLRRFDDSELGQGKYPHRTELLRPLEPEESHEEFWSRVGEAQEDDSIPEEDVISAAAFNVAVFPDLNNGL